MSFPPTRLSVVQRTRSDDHDVRRLAFEALIAAYWKPVYKYLRLQWHLDNDTAADYTQEFFATALEKDVLARYDPARARFRTYVRMCVDGFAANARKAEGRLKRGGAHHTVSLDFAAAEGELAHHVAASDTDLDELFYREWVRQVFQLAVSDLRGWAEATGKQAMFEVFTRYDLAEAHGDRPTYAAIGEALGLTTATVTNHLAAVRRQFRQCVLARLRDLTTSDAEFESEARRLVGGGR